MDSVTVTLALLHRYKHVTNAFLLTLGLKSLNTLLGFLGFPIRVVTAFDSIPASHCAASYTPSTHEICTGLMMYGPHLSTAQALANEFISRGPPRSA